MFSTALSYFVLLYSLLAILASANVEKAIFLAPEAIHIPKAHPNLGDLLIDSLSPSNSWLRTKLNASFPTNVSPKGVESWFLLEDLNPKQRYEVRICWLAIQPTEFWIYPWKLSEVFEVPKLITSLTTYSYARRDLAKSLDRLASPKRSSSQDSDGPPESVLFLQVYSAADYFSLNRSLMENVPPVDVDIILDPYLLNVFPKSLVPTAGYICVLAVGGWFLAGFVWKLLSGAARELRIEEDKKFKDGGRSKKDE